MNSLHSLQYNLPQSSNRLAAGCDLVAIACHSQEGTVALWSGIDVYDFLSVSKVVHPGAVSD